MSAGSNQEPVTRSSSAPFRLAYMTGEYPRATDTFIRREVAALRALGHTVETLAIRRPPDKQMTAPDVVAERDRTFYVLAAGVPAIARAHLSLLLRDPGRYADGIRAALAIRPPGLKALARQLAYFAEAGVVARRVQQLQLRHLHNHFANSSGSVAAIAAALGGFTFSLTMHGPAEFYEPKYWFVGEKVRRALFVNCISYFCRSQVMVFAPPAKWDTLHVIHCGVDPEAFAPHAETAGARLLFVGRLAAVKGLPILLHALAKLVEGHPTVTLDVAGDGPDRAMLAELAATLDLTARVNFLGYQSEAQVRDLLRQTDVFVMASFAEGVPVVLMEAMAAGTPVVATRVAGIGELVDDGRSGLLVPPADPDALATAVARLLGDPDLRQRFAAAGRATVDREFNLRHESDRLVTVMSAALGGTAAPVRP